MNSVRFTPVQVEAIIAVE
ncbi:hypothetical protein HaLaN_11500 [Haematococcus lacustris]|uniref:Uncharacterized protein n=1 Tax=Haematococcus lacustris TaxID=44745 RepID=A0A699Z7V2_HAELA|nr:hypothetical protein HaLaN_11500 [Haematococcus lacustris]